MVLDNEDSKKFALRLVDQHSKDCVTISNLEKSLPHIDLKNSLIETLKCLESTASIYIERNPRLDNGEIRRDMCPDDIVYFDTFPEITRRSLLYKTGVEYGDHTINHVLGCAHGCNYPCYAMQISKRYGRVSDYDDWMHPKLVGNAMELLEQEIPKLNSKIKFVHLSFMTDPFMYDAVNKRTFPWVQDLTLKIIRRLNEENIKVTALTKGLLPIELKEEEYNKDNEYGITLVSFDSKFHERYEPFSPSGEDRLKGLMNLHDVGLKTWVSLEPYPTPNIVKQELTDLLEKVRFVDKLIFGKWNYNPEVNGFETSKKFYTKCSDTVIDFCKQNDIALHIKKLTPKNTTKTQDLFK
ncbi:MAG: radical SAM protein [Candidatus Thorarchaeota archaeon]